MKKQECVGPYTLLSPLCGGARAHVWLASMGDGESRVALKLVRSGDAAGRARLLHEVDIAGSFDHPNIVRMYECGEADGVLWMASGYVPGPQATLTLANFRQLLLALVHVHAHGVVHADIRPENLLLDQHGDLRLAGFGHALREGARADAAAGSGRLMPPEQLRGEGIDARADLYCAGAVLYQILTGKRPFDGKTLRGTGAGADGVVAPPSTIVKGLGASFDALIEKSLADDKAARYGSAFAMLKDFDAACSRGVRAAV